MALNKYNDPGVLGVPDWHASSFYDYEKWVINISGGPHKPIFRGQRKNWPLLPRVTGDVPRGTILKNEKKLLEEFKKKAPPCLQSVPNNDLDWLVVAQHHGLPTRLLDWTYNPYVALWFAFEKSNEPESQPEVWMLSASKDELFPSQENARPFSGNRTKVFAPSFNIPRVKAQEACFTLFKYKENSEKGFVPLEENAAIRRRLTRIKIANYAREEIQKKLLDKGYTKDRLYPDIDEVARQVKRSVIEGRA